MDEERDRDDQQAGVIRGGEGLADGASSPEAAPGIPSDLGEDSIRGDGLAEDAGPDDADASLDAAKLGRDGIRGDGLAEDA